MMTIRHFRIFKAVSETGSFTKAAEKLFITQSAVSHAIREMEERTGTPLFDRLSKNVKMTRGGELLLERITPILKSCDALEKNLDSLERQAPIHVVSNITIAAFWLPGILQEFYREWPDISVHVDVLPAEAAINILRQGNADMAFIEGASLQGPFCCLPFASYFLKTVCAADYPAGSHAANISIAEFCAEKLMLREPGSAIRDALDSALYLAGYQVNPIWCSVNSFALIQAAKAGLGITVLPDVLVEEEVRKGKLLSLSIPGLPLKNDMFAVWHREKYLSLPMKSLLSIIESRSEKNRSPQL